MNLNTEVQKHSLEEVLEFQGMRMECTEDGDIEDVGQAQLILPQSLSVSLDLLGTTLSCLCGILSCNFCS